MFFGKPFRFRARSCILPRLVVAVLDDVEPPGAFGLQLVGLGFSLRGGWGGKEKAPGSGQSEI